MLKKAKKTLFWGATIFYLYKYSHSTSEGWNEKNVWLQYQGDRAWLACRWWRTRPGSDRTSQAVERRNKLVYMINAPTYIRSCMNSNVVANHNRGSDDSQCKLYTLGSSEIVSINSWKL